MSNGIIATSLCPKYFEVGAAFRLKVGTNDYRNAILVKYSNERVTFKSYDRVKEKIVEFSLFINDLMYHNDFELIKLVPDYENGKVSYKE